MESLVGAVSTMETEAQGPPNVVVVPVDGEMRAIPCSAVTTSNMHPVLFEVRGADLLGHCSVCSGMRRDAMTDVGYYAICFFFNSRICTWPEGTPSPRTQYRTIV